LQPRIPLRHDQRPLICGGAFVGLVDIIAERLGMIGFWFDQLFENCQVSTDGLLWRLKLENLEASG
jgi:hypothetical protein